MANRKIAACITAHAWSPDRKQIALCPNTEDVLIYSNADSADVSQWKLAHTLKGHDLVVSAIDWSPVHNKIVTCSHDRNAFVWTLKSNEWKPSLSILRINRAALCVKWSPDGKKFAVASGANVVPVCHYEEQNDWWISKMVKKHKSSVLWVAWHPSSQLLATASSDFRCRVFSAYIPDVDGGGCDAVICGNTSQTSFGEVLAEYDASNGWVEGCAWSPNGLTLGYVGHDSTVTFNTYDAKNLKGDPHVVTLRENFLPSVCILFLSDSVAVTAGHDFKPHVYQWPGVMKGDWKHLGSPEKEPAKSAEKPAAVVTDARTMWQNKTVKGQGASESADDAGGVWTLHTNSITDIKPFGDTQWTTKCDTFTTSGLDGRVIIWKGSEFKANVPGLNL
jgi:actin related protein 2/3 complex subunit 1A/1B